MIALHQGLLAFYALACIGFGSLSMRLIARKAWRLDDQPAYVVTAVYFLLGQGLLGNLWVVIALFGWFSPWVVGTLCVLFIAASLKPISLLAKRLLPELRNGIVRFRTASWPWKLIVLLAITLMLLAGVGSLLPPSSDAAAFYMPVARIISASHQLGPPRGTGEGWSHIGLLGELHYASLISLGSAEVAKEFNWLVGLATAVMVAAVCSRVGLSSKGQWVAIIMVATSTAVTSVIMNGKVDLFAASLGCAAFYYALQWGSNQQNHSLWLTGLFTGMAVVAKLSYAAALVPAVLILIVWQMAARQEEDLPKGARGLKYASTILQLGCGMALMAIPHMLKNGLLFGQPLAPFIATTGGGIITQEWFSPEVTRILVLTYPIALILGYTPMQGGHLSPLLLAFLPFAFYLQRPRRFFSSPLVQLTLSAMLGVAVWLVISPSILAPRYLLATVLMIIPVVAKGVDHVMQDRTRSRLLLGGTYATLLVLLAFSMITVGTFANQAVQIITGAYEVCDLHRADCWGLSLLNQHADMGDRVFIVGYYSDWLRPDLLQCVSNGAERNAALRSPSTEERWAYLIDRGFRFIAIEPGFTTYDEALDISEAPEWIEHVEIFQETGYRVHQIESQDPLIQPSMTCSQIDMPAWQIVPVDRAEGSN
jgi:hypothetical protein